MLASGDLVAVDVQAMKVLLSYEAKNKPIAAPWQVHQTITALRHRLGIEKNGYIVVSEPGGSHHIADLALSPIIRAFAMFQL